MTSVPRIGRILDLAGLLLLLGGGATFARAWIGFDGVRNYQPPPDAPAWSTVQLANGYLRMQRVGVALMVGGVVLFVVAWWTARRAAASRAA